MNRIPDQVRDDQGRHCGLLIRHCGLLIRHCGLDPQSHPCRLMNRIPDQVRDDQGRHRGLLIRHCGLDPQSHPCIRMNWLYVISSVQILGLALVLRSPLFQERIYTFRIVRTAINLLAVCIYTLETFRRDGRFLL